MMSQPALRNLSSWSVKSWSWVETRAYPYRAMGVSFEWTLPIWRLEMFFPTLKRRQATAKNVSPRRLAEVYPNKAEAVV
jgi:hypothetical protein